MKVRVGLLRAFIGVLWAALLIVPVGVNTAAGPEVASVGEALGELRRGSIGIGILSALVIGDDLARAALWRILLVALAAVAFVLAGMLRRGAEPPPVLRRRRCPYCNTWVSMELRDCPGCSRTLGAD